MYIYMLLQIDICYDEIIEAIRSKRNICICAYIKVYVRWKSHETSNTYLHLYIYIYIYVCVYIYPPTHPDAGHPGYIYYYSYSTSPVYRCRLPRVFFARFTVNPVAGVWRRATLSSLPCICFSRLKMKIYTHIHINAFLINKDIYNNIYTYVIVLYKLYNLLIHTY